MESFCSKKLAIRSYALRMQISTNVASSRLIMVSGFVTVAAQEALEEGYEVFIVSSRSEGWEFNNCCGLIRQLATRTTQLLTCSSPPLQWNGQENGQKVKLVGWDKDGLIT